MKKVQKQTGATRSITTIFSVLLVMLAFLFAACGDNGNLLGGKSEYTGIGSDGSVYSLVIREADSTARYFPKTGDRYELTVKPGNKKSEGTVVSADGGFELQPNGSDDTFTVMVDGGVMIAIAGEIRFVDSTFTEVFVSFIPQTGTAISGNTIVSGADVVYHPSLEPANKAEAMNGITFKYILSLRNDPPRADAINDALTSPATITLSAGPNGKATVIVPPPSTMQSLNAIFAPDVIFIPNVEVNYFGTEGDPVIFASDPLGVGEDDGGNNYPCATTDTIGLVCARDNTHIVGMTYVDRAVVMKGAKLESHGGLSIFDADLKQGWNYVFFTFTGANNQNMLFTASTSLPSNYKWTVIDFNYFD